MQVINFEGNSKFVLDELARQKLIQKPFLTDRLLLKKHISPEKLHSKWTFWREREREREGEGEGERETERDRDRERQRDRGQY